MKRWVLKHETDYVRSALQGWKGVELMTVVEWCVSGAKDLRFIGRDSISGEMSCGKIDWPT